jgi:hypothetical protein
MIDIHRRRLVIPKCTDKINRSDQGARIEAMKGAATPVRREASRSNDRERAFKQGLMKVRREVGFRRRGAGRIGKNETLMRANEGSD